MKIAVFGASGKTGREVVKLALEKGHSVVSVVRKPNSPTLGDNHNLFIGNVLDKESVIQAIKGADAVVSCIGPDNNFAPGDFMTKGITNILSACEMLGVGRFVMQSGITAGSGEELSLSNRLVVKFFNRVYRKAAKDKSAAERAVQASSLAWVIVRAVGLQHAPAVGRYTAAPGADVRPLALLPYADCADCLLKAVDINSPWRQSIVNLGRPV